MAEGRSTTETRRHAPQTAGLQRAGTEKRTVGARGLEERSSAVPESGLAFARAVAREVDGLKADDVNILDVRGLTDVTDFMVLATGTSERHLKAMAAAVEAVAREEGRTLLGVEGAGPSGWIVVDAADVVAHLFSRSLRSYYDLDGLWADAASVDGQAKVASPGGEARGEAARGRGAQGEDAQGEGAQREDAPGEDARGEDARGAGAPGDRAQGEDAQGEDAPGGGPDEGAAG